MPHAPPDTASGGADAARVTKRGTPCARAWDAKWVRLVERREADVGRRICGARTVGGTPCLLPSDHPQKATTTPASSRLEGYARWILAG